MKTEKLERYLEEFSNNTDFNFTVKKTESGFDLYMQGDNPENEDWCTVINIDNPKDKNDLLAKLHKEIWKCYESFDVEEETYLMLEAKRNGLCGVPGVVDLVHNEEYKENALKEFAKKLRDLLSK